MRTLRRSFRLFRSLGSLAALALLAPLPSLTAQDAERRPLSARIHVELAHDSEREQATRDALLRLLDAHDVDRWILTDTVLIDETQIPHSHPVLTIHTRSRNDDVALLSTFLHEQFHWLEATDAGFRAAMAAHAETWPDAPAGPPEGARDQESTYRHLVVCDLEFQAVTALFGEEAARATLSENTHYTWIYATVLGDDRVRRTNDEHGMVVTRDFRGEHR